MKSDILSATSDYETWLREKADVQEKGLDRKHEQMSKGPFPFLRATFYRWVELWEKLCPDLHARDDDVLLAVGDLHLENFGIWLDSRRRLVWGINDFDEACELPFTSDLVRLATSIALAASERKIEVPLSEICARLLVGYREGAQAGGAPILVGEGGHPELQQLAAEMQSPAKFWQKKLNEEDNPKITGPDLPRSVEDLFQASFSRKARPEYRRQRKPGGLGSLGRRRFTAVDHDGNHREAREAKALVPSALYWWEDRSEMPSQTGTLLQRAIRSPDPHVQVHDKWFVRRIAPDAIKMDLPTSKEDRRFALAPTLVHLMGVETANIHLGSRAPAELTHSLEKLSRKPGAKWLEAATEQMLNATRADSEAWAKEHKPADSV